MNVFRLTKRSLVSTTSFSKSKNKNKSSVLADFFSPFFSKKGHSFNAFFKTPIQIQSSWQEDWKPSLIAFWMSMRAKVSPLLWLIRDTVEILATHIKATILPFLWHVRYVMGLIFARISTDLPPLLRHLRQKIVQLFVFLQTILSPVLRPMNRAFGVLMMHTAKALSPVLIPINNRIGQFSSQTKAVLAPVIEPINNQLAIYTPSVKHHCGRIKEAFFYLFAATWQLFKRQSLTTKFVCVTIVVVCSMSFNKSKNNHSLIADPSVKEGKNGVIVREYQTSGKLQKTLYNSLAESGISHILIGMVEEALKNKVDITQFAQGDEYKLIWEEESVDGHLVGVEQLTSVYFKGQAVPEPVYVYYFNNGIASGWFEKEGLPVRGSFIDSPVENSKITSRFNWRRKHPILGYRRPHLATDYAAPRGTPIMAVADGVVAEARYRMGNGRYVKIKHIPPYETEYLHMSRFGEGIEQGAFVKKRQIIGYIGMSGLTTGPHVCFKFWKQGKAIDHLTERFFTDTDNDQFKKMVKEKRTQLDKIPMLNTYK